MGAYTGLRFYNAPLSWSAGFITFVAGGDLQRTSQLPAGKWLSFSLPPLSGNSSRCTLRFGPGVTATPESYFVSFRQPTGFDLGLPSEARNVVQVGGALMGYWASLLYQLRVCLGYQEIWWHEWIEPAMECVAHGSTQAPTTGVREYAGMN
jgi:hypothetical protein